MNNKQKLVYLSLIALTIIGILSGASYAYFSIENKSGNNTVIESGTMALTLRDGSTITVDKLIPGSFIEKEFSVENTGTLITAYDIYLSEVVNTFVDQSDLVYEIISTDGGYNTSNQVQVPNIESKIINSYSINPLQEHHYKLRITYKLTNDNQNDNMGRTFIAKININEYNQNTNERYIKLIDSSNNVIDKQVLTNNTEYYYPLSNINLNNSTNIYCDNGGIPTIENNQLKVSEVSAATECRISNSINTTITNLPNTKTGIVMTNNQSGNTGMTIPNGKEVVLDLNGKELNYQFSSSKNIIVNYGTLEINDSIGTGKMKSNYIILTNVNELIVNNGNYIRENSDSAEGGIIGNYSGQITINGGYYHTDKTWGIFNSSNNLSSIIINGGEFESELASTTINNAGGVNCSIEINDGIFRAKNFNISNSAGTLTINNGYFECNNINVRETSTGTININGGTFIAPSSGTSSCVISNGSPGTINISDTNRVYIGLFNETSDTWSSKGVVNTGSGTININGHIADVCNQNINSNSSGICIYATKRAVLNEDVSTGVININGAYIVSRDTIAIAHFSKETKIKNVYAKGYDTALQIEINNKVVNPEQSILKICNSTLVGPYKNIVVLSSYAGYAAYSNIYFSNGTTSPGNKIEGSIVESSDACNW